LARQFSLQQEQRYKKRLLQALIAGLGISIMPLIGLKNELEGGELKIIPIKGLPITTDWRLVWLRNKPLTPVAKAFLDFVQEKKDAIFENSVLNHKLCK
jgi:DNA-binding transcriptional LysR family regulator